MRSNRWGWCVLLFVLLSAGIQAQEVSEPIQVLWFIGLGGGIRSDQLDVEQQIIDEFNASQTAIHLEMICACGDATASDMLDTLIRSGHPPDIVGPVSIEPASEFADQWLDLQPLVDKTGYDLSRFPPNTVETFRSSGGLHALPFIAFPGVLYYNADLFDAAGLNYPPTHPSEPYIMPDGTELPWDYDTLITLAQRLTLDVNGHSANSVDFNPDDIVQYGFVHQWETLISDFHTFGAAPLIDDEGQVVIHDNWRAQMRWMRDGIWTYHVMPAFEDYGPVNSSNFFALGHTAMARSMLWYTCCLEELTAHWDLAVQPAYKGQIYAPMDADSFYIPKDSTHPDEAFVVLRYLMESANSQLMEIYNAFPADPDFQADALALKAKQFPLVQNWDVVLTSIPLAPALHYGTWHSRSNPGTGQWLMSELVLKLHSQEGRTMNLDAELDQFRADLQMIIDTNPGDCIRYLPKCGK